MNEAGGSRHDKICPLRSASCQTRQGEGCRRLFSVLLSPLVNAEPGTISWFAIQEGPSRFAIFDTFDDEGGRDAHLNGKVAATLMEKAEAGLFEKMPEIHKIEIIADKLPKKAEGHNGQPNHLCQPKRLRDWQPIPAYR
jgi:quinol monooxygenase YgiN